MSVREEMFAKQEIADIKKTWQRMVNVLKVNPVGLMVIHNLDQL